MFEDVGQWKRARYFPRTGEDMHAAVARECRAVRQSVGIFDASTLGKIEVVGPDAAEFLNRIYTNPWTKLEPGPLPLRPDAERGRLRSSTTASSAASPPTASMSPPPPAARRASCTIWRIILQTEWSDLECWLTSTTEQWAVIAVQGPSRARSSSAACRRHRPLVRGHAAYERARRPGLRRAARLFRVSFTGELGFEINVPADYGRAVWEAVIDAGCSRRITPYGTEAMHVLRAEKGYIIVGQDTDGTVTPDDVGLAWAIGKTKTDFVGKRSLARPAMVDPERKQLVGLLPENPELVLEEGAQIVADRPPVSRPSGRQKMIGQKMIGHVTSSYFSAALGRPIALAMVEGGRRRIGETLYVPMPEGAITAVVANPVFLDPEGKRLDA